MTVTAAHDNNTLDDQTNVAFQATGGGYNNAAGILGVTVTDNDLIGVNISEDSLTLTEGQSKSYTVVLGAVPTGNVTVTIQGPSNRDIIVQPDSLTFTQDDWDDEQTVTVTTGQDDDHLDEAQAQIAHSVSGGGYDNLAVDSVQVTVQDDDHPRVTTGFGQNSAAAPEGSRVQVTASLSTAPERSVKMPISVTLQGGATADDYSGMPRDISFSSEETQKTFSFTITDDMVDDDGESLRISFGNLPDRVALDSAGNPSVTVTITDDDEASVTVAPTSLELEEGESDRYTVVLGSQPTGDVTVTLGVPKDAPFTVSGPTLTFTEDNWDTEQTVTVTTVQDQDADDEPAATITHTLSGGGYAGQTASGVAVTVTDDDGPAVKVNYGKSVYETDEGSMVEVSITLDGEPGRSLTVPLAVIDQSTATTLRSSQDSSYASSDDYSGVPTHVTFGENDTEKKFNFTATDDTDDDDGEIVSLAFRTLPPGVSTGRRYTANVRINDNDTPAGVEINFEEKTYEVDETDDAGTADTKENEVTVTVTLSEDPEADPDGAAYHHQSERRGRCRLLRGPGESHLQQRGHREVLHLQGRTGQFGRRRGNRKDRLRHPPLRPHVRRQRRDHNHHNRRRPHGELRSGGVHRRRRRKGSGKSYPQRGPRRGDGKSPSPRPTWAGASDSDYSGVPESVTFDDGDNPGDHHFHRNPGQTR